MFDWNTRRGKRISRRLSREIVIWLTTIDRSGRPQPRPVWFLWQDGRCLIFSRPQAAKLIHIRKAAWVSLNLNSDHEGDEVTVMIGPARILKRRPQSSLVDAYLRKYRAAIRNLGYTPSAFLQDYSVPVVVTPKLVRGF